jgi:RND family efflux transporter MFP subunit
MVMSQRAQAVEQSQINLQTEKAKLEQQKASLARLDWRVQLAKRNLVNTVLKAPFDGIVRSTAVEIGKTVSANDVVVSLYEDANMDVRFTLTDERYGRLQADQSGLVGREIEIIWTIGGREYSYPAMIERVGAEISSSRGGVEIFAAIQQIKDNPAIRPGAFVEIHVPDVLFINTAIVPDSAIYDGNRIYLKIRGKLVSQQVNVLAHNDGSVLISGEFEDKDRALITRIAEISDGITVREEGDATPPRSGRKPDSKAGRGS